MKSLSKFNTYIEIYGKGNEKNENLYLGHNVLEFAAEQSKFNT